MIQAIKKEEASRKMCPMAMSTYRPDSPSHWNAGNYPFCISDECMAWVPCVTIDDKPEKGYCGMIWRKVNG